MVYLFLSVSDDNVNLAKVLVSAFAGGCAAHHDFTPVIVDWSDSAKLSELQKTFDVGLFILNNLHQINENLGNVKIHPCRVLKPESYTSNCRAVDTMAANVAEMRHSLNLCHTLTDAFADTALNANDGFIVIANMDDKERECSMITALGAMLALRNSGSWLASILVSHNIDQLKCVFSNSDYLLSFSDVVLIGNRNDYHKRDISVMQTANAVIDALSAPMSGLPSVAPLKGMYYECENLASEQMKNSMNNLRKIVQLYRAEQNGELKDWKDRILVDSKNMWEYNDLTKAIVKLNALVADWTTQIESFKLFSGSDISGYISACNKHPKLQMTSSNGQRYREVVAAISGLVKKTDSIKKSYTQFTRHNDDDIFCDISEGVSPVLWLKRSAKAFSCNLPAERMREGEVYRKACLDGWQIAFDHFYGQSDAFEDAESSINDKIACAVLGLSKEGRRIVDMGNPLTLSTNGSVWISDPSVGFACLRVGKVNHGELEDRTPLREFLFGYCMLFADVLDADFVQYVKKANEVGVEKLPKTVKEFLSASPECYKDIPLYFADAKS